MTFKDVPYGYKFQLPGWWWLIYEKRNQPGHPPNNAVIVTDYTPMPDLNIVGLSAVVPDNAEVTLA